MSSDVPATVTEADRDVAKDVLCRLTYYKLNGINPLATRTELECFTKYKHDIDVLAQALAEQRAAIYIEEALWWDTMAEGPYKDDQEFKVAINAAMRYHRLTAIRRGEP